MRITNVDVAAIVMGRKGVDSWGLWRNKAILCLLQVLLVNLCEGTFLLSVSVCVDGTCWHRLATNIFWVSWCPTDQQTLWERTCAIIPSWGTGKDPHALLTDAICHSVFWTSNIHLWGSLAHAWIQTGGKNMTSAPLCGAVVWGGVGQELRALLTFSWTPSWSDQNPWPWPSSVPF